MFELRIEATGEVRDQFGNLIEQVPIRQTLTLTKDDPEYQQLLKLIEGQAAQVEGESP